MINNFELIKELLNFPTPDTFYFGQILKRKKEHPELGSNSYVVKTYYIKSLEDLEFYKGEMICLADYHNARVCINLNRRSFRKVAFHTMKKVVDQILNEEFKSVRAAYNSVCGEYSEGDKRWILDIDGTKQVSPIMMGFINDLQPFDVLQKNIAIIPTKNGVHLITSPFDVQTFKMKYPDIEIHKNNPTILYIPSYVSKEETEE